MPLLSGSPSMTRLHINTRAAKSTSNGREAPAAIANERWRGRSKRWHVIAKGLPGDAITAQTVGRKAETGSLAGCFLLSSSSGQAEPRETLHAVQGGAQRP